MFTLNQLNAIMPVAAKAGRTALFYDDLLKYMQEYDINTLERMACFLATIAVESGELRYTRELWGPTDAQKRYTGRGGNLTDADSFAYRGAGLIQITFKDGFKAAGTALNLDLINHPELLGQPEYATLSACWWWWKNGCNELADGNNPIEKTSKRVNVGNANSSVTPNGWTERQAYYNTAIKILSHPDFSNVESGSSFSE